MAAASSSPARALLLLLLRPRQQQPLRLRFASAVPARLPDRRCFLSLLLQQQPRRCWASIGGGAAPSRGVGSSCDEAGYPQPQAPAVVGPDGAPAPTPHDEEGQAPACGCGGGDKAIPGAEDDGKGAASQDTQAAPLRAAAGRRRRRSSSSSPPRRRRTDADATARQGDRAVSAAKRKGKGGHPTPPRGPPKEGRGGQGGIHH